jgi:hypothetical protein
VFPFVDMDYLSALSPEERAYLETFSAEYYNSEFSANPLHKDEAQRREINLTKRYRVEDIYERANRASGDGSSTETAAPGRLDEWLTPKHLGDSAYRAALTSFRSHIPADNRRKVSYTPGFLDSRAKLDELAGVLTCTRNNTAVEEAMSKNRLDRLKETRQIVFNVGYLLSNSEFKGEQSMAVAQGLGWLEQMIQKLDLKLKALGYEAPKPPSEGGQ